jgi:hypothetical protein
LAVVLHMIPASRPALRTALTRAYPTAQAPCLLGQMQ